MKKESVLYEYVRNWISKNIHVIGAVVICGLFAHGFCLFNKISINDDINSLFDVGNTFNLGRWFLAVMAQINRFFFGGNFSIPVYSGLISITILAFSCSLITSVLNIENKVHCFLLGAIFVSMPTVTGLFGYMFTAPYYLGGRPLEYAVPAFYVSKVDRKPWELF